MTYLESLRDAIREMHGCDSVHVETVHVRTRLTDQAVWEGDIEVFNLKNHPHAKRCFAWVFSRGGNGHGSEYAAVLELPPVDSPEAAVRMAMER